MPNAGVRLLTGAAVAGAVALAACSQENHYVAPPPPKVTVALPVQRPVTRYLELTGNTAAVKFVGGTASPTLLATIVQVDPIYANFNISERDVLRLRAELARRGVTRDDLNQVPVEIGLQTESGYPHVGTFDYASPIVNSSTGTLAARGIFQNADRVLLPGYFSRVRIPVEQQSDALLVPDSALGGDQGGRYVLVVNKDNLVEHRNVTIGPLAEGLRVIEGGLKPDERVVIAGVLRAIPGQQVDPQQQAAPAATAAAGAR